MRAGAAQEQWALVGWPGSCSCSHLTNTPCLLEQASPKESSWSTVCVRACVRVRPAEGGPTALAPSQPILAEGLGCGRLGRRAGAEAGGSAGRIPLTASKASESYTTVQGKRGLGACLGVAHLRPAQGLGLHLRWHQLLLGWVCCWHERAARLQVLQRRLQAGVLGSVRCCWRLGGLQSGRWHFCGSGLRHPAEGLVYLLCSEPLALQEAPLRGG